MTRMRQQVKETKKRTRLVKIIFIMPDKLIYILYFAGVSWRGKYFRPSIRRR